MQHQTLTMARTVQYLGGRYLAARYLTRDGYRSVMHYADIPEASAALRAIDPMRDPRAVSAREQAIAMFESAIDADGSMLAEMRVLSIDAWRDAEGGWTWNNWHARGTVTRREFARECNHYTRAGVRRTLRWFRENGYLSAESAGRVALEDDGHNLVVTDRATGEPLFAIEYGAVIY